MSHKDAPPETAEQRRMREFYTALLARESKTVGWGRDQSGNYFAPYARHAWAAWQEAQRRPPSDAPFSSFMGGLAPMPWTEERGRNGAGSDAGAASIPDSGE